MHIALDLSSDLVALSEQLKEPALFKTIITTNFSGDEDAATNPE
jgi:hypothetical protein